MMQTRSLLDMQEFIRRLIVQIIFQVLLYHLILMGLLFNSFFSGWPRRLYARMYWDAWNSWIKIADL